MCSLKSLGGAPRSRGRRNSAATAQAWRVRVRMCVFERAAPLRNTKSTRTLLNSMSPEIPPAARLRRLKESCHFADTWLRRASEAAMDAPTKRRTWVQCICITCRNFLPHFNHGRPTGRYPRLCLFT